jgi:hypothetical protein
MNIDSIVRELKAERDRLTLAIDALEGTVARGYKNLRRGVRRRRPMSAAARRRISAAMKARWAQRRK